MRGSSASYQRFFSKSLATLIQLHVSTELDFYILLTVAIILFQLQNTSSDNAENTAATIQQIYNRLFTCSYINLI